MFNLLVSYSGWIPPSDSIDKSRVLEHTDVEAKRRVMQGDSIDFAALTAFPALIMTEEGSDPFEARVGTITRATQRSGNVEFNFHYEDGIAPVSLASLKEMASELHINVAGFELTRTHWALKEADLFKVLCRHARGEQPSPRIHGIDRYEPADPDQVSVMIRFRADFDQVFGAVKDAAEAFDFKCERVKDIWEKDAIISDVASLIMRSQVVVADLTDRNTNVFYECGFAHGVGRDVIPITQDAADSFDVAHLRHVIYDNTDAGRERLTEKLKARFEALRAAT